MPLPPALAGASVYFGMGNTVFALNKDTLAQRWAYDAGSPVHTPPAYSPGTQTVIVVSQDLYVHAINAGNGTQRWRVKPTPLQPGDPGGGRDYAQAGNGWPVIAERHGLVFVRYRLDWQTMWNWGLKTTNDQMRTFLQNNPDEQPLFALRLGDGSPAFIPNVGNGGFGDGDYMPMGPLPVVKFSLSENRTKAPLSCASGKTPGTISPSPLRICSTPGATMRCFTPLAPTRRTCRRWKTP